MPTSSVCHSPVSISVGTRPEIIKMAPVYAELRRRGVPVSWVHTRQHREMADTQRDLQNLILQRAEILSVLKILALFVYQDGH